MTGITLRALAERIQKETPIRLMIFPRVEDEVINVDIKAKDWNGAISAVLRGFSTLAVRNDRNDIELLAVLAKGGDLGYPAAGSGRADSASSAFNAENAMGAMPTLHLTPQRTLDSASARRKAPTDLFARLESDGPQTIVVLFRDKAVDDFLSQFQPEGQARIDAMAFAYEALRAFAFGAVKAYGLKPLQQFSHLPVASLRVEDEEQLLQLLRLESVYRVDLNRQYKASASPNLAQINQDFVRATTGNGGARTTVAVLDSGINIEQPDFECVAPGFPTQGRDCRVVYAGYLPDVSDGRADDDPHGNNVAGIVAKVAPDAKIFSVDIFPTGYHTSTEDLYIWAGINRAISYRAQFNIVSINLSLGNFTYGSTGYCSDSMFGPVFGDLRNLGVVPVVASGNDGSRTNISFPACSPGAVAVASVNSYDSVSPFSNVSGRIDIFAPGENIEAGGVTMSGTSMAAPHVAAAVAVLRSANPDWSADHVVTQLKSSPVVIVDDRAIPVFSSERRLDVRFALGLGSPVPRNLEAADGASTSGIALSWLYPLKSGPAEPPTPTFDIYRRAITDSPPAPLLAGNVPGNSYFDSTAMPGVRYHYWVRRAGDPPDANLQAYDAGYRAVSAEPKLAGGHSHSLLQTSSGFITAWGSNFAGQLGDGTQSARSQASNVMYLGSYFPYWNLGPINSLVADHYASFVLLGTPPFTFGQSSTVFGWGDMPGSWQYGNAPNNTSSWTPPGQSPFVSPTELDVLAGPATQLAAGNGLVALQSDHRMMKYPSFGYSLPHYQMLAGDLRSVARSWPVNFALTYEGEVRSFVDSRDMEFNPPILGVPLTGCVALLGRDCEGDGSIITSSPDFVGWGPQNAFTRLQAVQQVAALGEAAIARTSYGSVFGWGTNRFGQLGPEPNNQTRDYFSPRTILFQQDVVQIAAGLHHALALRADGTVVSWGANYFCTSYGSLPSQLPYAAEEQLECSSGTSKRYGQTGQRKNFDIAGPDLVVDSAGVPLNDIVYVSAGGHTSLAVRRDGTLFMWGLTPDSVGSRNAATPYIELPDGTMVERASAAADADGDGVPDAVDNCRGVANPSQLDSDQDGFGNICDGDLNGSGLTTAVDFNIFRSVLNQSTSSSISAASADMNGSGAVTALDFNLLRNGINHAPGPGSAARHWHVRINNVDDLGEVLVNDQVVLSCYYGQDCEADLSQYLVSGYNSLQIRFTNFAGGWTYGYQVTADGDVIAQDSCGTSGVAGCLNDNQTSGIVLRRSIAMPAN